MSKISVIGISAPAFLSTIVFVGIGLSPVCSAASTIGLSDISNHVINLGRPDHVPPGNPPLDTPAFYNGLANAPSMMPSSIPSHTLPGSGFGQAAVPIPAAVWLFGSGLLGLVGLARSKITS
jgi:hypothetical protein